MAATTKTLDPNAMARALSTKGRVVTPKSVRNMARGIIGRFDKTRHPAYQSHEYTAAEQKTLREAFAASGQRAKVQPKRTARKATAPKRAARPVAAVAKVAPDA